jgi:hypothetical protein
LMYWGVMDAVGALTLTSELLPGTSLSWSKLTPCRESWSHGRVRKKS